MSEKMVALGALIVGALALIASAVQSFLLWEERNDVWHALLVSQVVDRCNSFVENYEKANATLRKYGVGNDRALLEEAEGLMRFESFEVIWLGALMTSAGSSSSIIDEIKQGMDDDLAKLAEFPEKFDAPKIDQLVKARWTLESSIGEACRDFVATQVHR